MKSLFTTTLLAILFTSTLTAQNSYERLPGYEPILNQSELFGERNSDDCNVLLLRDREAIPGPNPWDPRIDHIQPILDGQGATVTIAGSADIPVLDFSAFCVIVIESNQLPAFYDAFNANLTKFTNYVEEGGVLQIHTVVATIVQVAPITLPGGVTIEGNPENNNVVVIPGHPIVLGVPSPFSGFSASNGYFDNLMQGTLIITEEENNSRPTTIEYTLGAGLVIATTVSLEFAYHNGWDNEDMLPNSLQYSCGGGQTAEKVPLSNLALYLGLLLMIIFFVFRYRKIV